MKRAIIIGASSGLGFEVAKLLLDDGWQLGVAARRLSLLEQLKMLCPGRVETARIDVLQADAEAGMLKLIERLGGVDLFFYSSGIGRQNEALQPETELSTVSTNALGFTRMVGAAYRYMAEHGGGHIAAISSIAGTKGLGVAPSYSATKAFQNIYLQALRQQANMRRLDIAITDIRPGFVATALLGDNPRYPILMDVKPVARLIVKAVKKRKRVCVIDWRWRIITALWSLIPNRLWCGLRIR